MSQVDQQVLNEKLVVQDLCVVGSTGYKLPDLIADWTHLLLEGEKHDEAVALYKEFMEELTALGEKIETKNKSKRTETAFAREFQAFDPRNFECSVSI